MPAMPAYGWKNKTATLIWNLYAPFRHTGGWVWRPTLWSIPCKKPNDWAQNTATAVPPVLINRSVLKKSASEKPGEENGRCNPALCGAAINVGLWLRCIFTHSLQNIAFRFYIM